MSRGLRGPSRGEPGVRACMCVRDEAETAELEPVSLGRGPGECSVDCDLVGTSFPSYAPCHLIEEM